MSFQQVKMPTDTTAPGGTAEKSLRHPEEHGPDISFFELLAPLLRRWKLIAGAALGCGIAAAIVLLLQRPVYSGETNFTPEAPSNAGIASSIVGLAGLAGQLGLGSTTAASVSPDFFAQLLHSREVLRAVLLTEFPNPHTGGAGSKQSLLDLLEIHGRSPEERLQKGSRLLTKLTEANVDKPTGIVTLNVKMHWPDLASAVANRMIELLNRFNLERRQSQSHEQRRFTQTRLHEADQELRAAERSQLQFLQTNRQYVGSPLLEFQAAQLQRGVQVKQEVFLTLTKAYEEARIAEVRDTPVLTVIDTAVAPYRRSSPHRTLGVVIALVFGALVGVAAAYMIDFQTRTVPGHLPDHLAAKEALAQTRRDIGKALGHHR